MGRWVCFSNVETGMVLCSSDWVTVMEIDGDSAGKKEKVGIRRYFPVPAMVVHACNPSSTWEMRQEAKASLAPTEYWPAKATYQGCVNNKTEN